MGALFNRTHKHITSIEPDSVIVEIGSDFGVQHGLEGGEGSTLYFAELAEKYDIILHTVDINNFADRTVNHASIRWHQSIGSSWAKDIYPTIDKKISMLYLDNYYFNPNSKLNQSPNEYIISCIWTADVYNQLKGADWPNRFVTWHLLSESIRHEVMTDYPDVYAKLSYDGEANYNQHGLTELSNNNCQIEHFTQLYYLYNWLSDDCVVVFDDTFRYNDCWIGKNGTGVVFLQLMGFIIVEENSTGVILKRGKQ